MNIDVKDLKAKAKHTAQWIFRHRVIVTIVSIVLLYSWLVLQINLLNRREPSDEAVAEKLQTVKRPRIDQQTIDKIQSLQDNNVDVRTLFKQARDNPFQE